MLRFQVYSTLAYGARGIAYFHYFTSPTGNYRMGPIDQFGNPTPTWYFMQHANLQIASLAPTLLQLTNDDVYHLTTVPDGCHGPGEQDLIASIDGGEFMVGDFTHRDKSRYVMIVNKDINKSTWFALHFRKTPKRLRQVSSYTGQLVDFSGEQRCLAPGQGMLLKVDWE